MTNEERMNVEIARRRKFIKKVVDGLATTLESEFIDHIEEEEKPGWSRSDRELENSMRASVSEWMRA